MDHTERHRRVRALFEELHEQRPGAQAEALAHVRADDPSLAAEVSRLLEAAAQAGSFLEHGAADALADESNLIGRKLGAYQIVAVLGTGGMGCVYRARDTVLGREVALKLLSEPALGDPERLARFRREAQILASLNHPNIAAIYGRDESEGMPKLVLELVEGPTLAERLEHGALSLDETLRVARQIVDALEAAHAVGVVHRDLKPANIKMRADGTVKVLDFGLAKSIESGVPPDPALTRAGMILGTAPCMSPEQARGLHADRRSDIWAFGCVMFEMLTGCRAFGGDSVSDTLANILTREPDWSLLPADTPASIHRLLRRCLSKNPQLRLADIADARLELDELSLEPVPASKMSRSADPRRWLPWSLAIVGLAATLVLLVSRYTERPSAAAHVYRASILLPGTLGTARNAFGTNLALSPDGRQLAFIATDESGHTRLWIRALDESNPAPLADTLDAQSPFWSPDGRWVAFVQRRSLKKVAITGGNVVTLCEGAMMGGAWNSDDEILFTQTAGILARISAAGGTPRPVTTIAGNRGEVFNVQPFYLPDGRSFGYVSLGVGSAHNEVHIASLDGSASRLRLPIDAAMVQYAAGFLWFSRGSTLMAQPWNARRRNVAGEAVPIAEQVRIDNGQFRSGVFSVSAAGTLIYQRDTSPGFELTWYDRQGQRLGTLGTPAGYADPQISPDGQRVLVSIAPTGSTKRDLWMFDVARGLRTRFTFDDEYPIRGPIWTPDGTRVVFAAEHGGQIRLVQKVASGPGELQTLLDDPFDKEPLSWSPDGRHLLYARRREIARPVSWVLPAGEGGAPFPLPQARATFPQFSPDGQWILYVSSESGRQEVYVAPFPGPGSRWQISTAGGHNPRWRRDGREIVYHSITDDKLMSAAISIVGDRVEVGRIEPLFDLPWVGPRHTFDVSPDGKRILALIQPSAGASEPLTLVVNWPLLLSQASSR